MFNEVVKFSTVSIVLAIVAKRNMHMHYGDIETLFLNANPQEVTYMRQPKRGRGWNVWSHTPHLEHLWAETSLA
jgi:hypothetical protein